MPEPLPQALAGLRPLLLGGWDGGPVSGERLVRAVAAGRRHGGPGPAPARAELRPVRLKAGPRLQLVTTDGRGPTTRNLEPGGPVVAAVDELLAEPFGSWRVETDRRVVQLRVTKRGQAQVHVERRDAGSVDQAADGGGDESHDRAKRHLLDPADPLFGELGAGAAKRRQVDAFLRLLAPVALPVLRDAAAQARPLRVLDLGCGNAYLTYAAHRYLTRLAAEHGTGDVISVETVGIDARADLVDRNTALAERLGMAGLAFEAGTITRATGDPTGSAAAGRQGADVVLALHACDTATDDAIAAAVRQRATVLLAAPCCHHDLQRQLARAGSPLPALTRDGILRERFADVLTDAARAALLRSLGHRVDVVEFVESRHTPRNTLLRAVRTGRRSQSDERDAAVQYADLVRTWQIRPVLADLLAAELAGVLPGLPDELPDGADERPDPADPR